jgi:hypothetical protein
MIILLNGPANIGKDYAIEHLLSLGYDLEKAECKDRLHEMTMQFFNVEPRKYWPLYNNRDTKEVPQECYGVTRDAYIKLTTVLHGKFKARVRLFFNLDRQLLNGCFYLSPREAMIFVSECVAKPAFGNDCFGVYRANKVKSGKDYFDASCFGSSAELEPLIKKIGQDEIILIRVYSDKHRFDSNDSRSYVPDGVINKTYDVHNNGTLEEYLKKIEMIYERKA